MGGRAAAAHALVAAAVLATAVPAPAAVPQSLKDSCQRRDAADANTGNGFQRPYFLCDDGVPPSGGTTPNAGAVRAIAVPQRYLGFRELPDKALPPDLESGADAQGNIALDANLTLPDPSSVPPGSRGYPLVVMMHGCCGGSKVDWQADTIDAPGTAEKWHYSNAWFASRGYAVLTYTARGFVDGSGRGSTGQTQLDDRRYEMNDYQHLAGQIADTTFTVSGRTVRIDPARVVVTGGSYGGGFSWMALTDPTWTSPEGKAMRLAAAAPRYGWTDLAYSLVPTGTHLRDRLPATDGSDSTTPFAFPKRSILAGLYASGKTGVPPGSSHATFPQFVDEGVACLESTDPYESNPLCATTFQTTVPGFIANRSAYYQQDFFDRVAAGEAAARVPLFSAGTFTDPLFTHTEHRRMVDRLRSIDRGYPVQEYYGDYQHFAQNKRKEWSDLCGADRDVCTLSDYPGGNLNANPAGLAGIGVNTRLNRFVDHFVRPPGNASQPAPALDVTASLQICPANASQAFPLDGPGPRFTAATFDALARGRLTLRADGAQTTTNKAAPNPHAVSSDPIENELRNGKRCPVETTPAGPGVATYDMEPLDRDYTMIGRTRVTVPHTGTGEGLQLNARLYDLFPDGRAVMVDRGVRRVAAANETTVFDLHGNGWLFPKGHRVRVELAQDDEPFIRASSQPSSLTLSGVTLEIPVREGAPPTALPRIRLSVSPSRAIAGRRTRFRFRAVVGQARRPVAGVAIRFAGRTVRTDAAGRAQMRVRLSRRGRRRARATKAGLRAGSAFVTVTGRGSGGGSPRFTG